MSGFLTCKVLHLSGNFMLKRDEFTFVLPLYYMMKSNKTQWKNNYKLTAKIKQSRKTLLKLRKCFIKYQYTVARFYDFFYCIVLKTLVNE